LAARQPFFANPDVDVIVLESVYPTVTEAVHNRIQMRLGFLHHVVAPLFLIQLKPRLDISPHQLRPIAELQNIQCPILIASGDRDAHTTIAETNRMFAAANEPKKRVIFDGAGHVDLLAHDPTKYEDDLLGYINQIIGERTGEAQ